MSFSVLESLLNNFERFPERNAFHIAGKYYSYNDLRKKVAVIQRLILSSTDDKDRYIGIYTFDDIETYAGIYAVWFSGKAFVPLNPRNPSLRNENILRQTGIRNVLQSKEVPSFSYSDVPEVQMLNSGGLPERESGNIEINPQDPDDDMYVLFTSGSTGDPKGVPITVRNLNSFTGSFINHGYDFSHEDRFLQIYDLSFDASVHCYAVPLSVGACVYTVPQDQIKYLYAYKLMSEKELTFVKMPPSTLAYLQPYFNSVNLPCLRYCLLGGEAFPEKLAREWSRAVPNTRIENVYGPTEATINCLIYKWEHTLAKPKSFGGIVSIGKTFGENTAIVVDEKMNILPPGRKGELCISGNQVTPGYWKNEEKNRESFFEKEFKGEIRRFYRTGDLVFMDEDGDFMFNGRIDTQVQIQGYRVELGEIEKHARDLLELSNVVAVAKENKQGSTEIYLFIENAAGKEDELSTYLNSRLPSYMIPGRIINLEELPKSVGGKISKAQLIKYLE